MSTTTELTWGGAHTRKTSLDGDSELVLTAYTKSEQARQITLTRRDALLLMQTITSLLLEQDQRETRLRAERERAQR